MWGIAAQIGLGLVNSSMQAKAASQQAAQANKVVQQYNKQVQLDTMQQVSQLNMQRASLRQQTTIAIFNSGLQGQSARDAISNQAAATDTIGASVNDAISSVNVKQSQAVGSAQEQFQQAIDQSNLMLQRVITQGTRSLKDPVNDQADSINKNAAFNAVGSAIGAVAGNSLGGGKPAGATSSASDFSAPNFGYDLQGRNSNPNASNNPFGLSFKFEANNLFGN